MTYNLQPSYPNVSVLTTNDKAISVMYGRVPITGEIVPILVDATGAVTTSGGGGITSLTGDVTASGSGAVSATVEAIQGVVVSGTAASGKVLTATSPTAATWQAPTGSTIVPILSTGNSPATGVNQTATVPGLLTTDTLVSVTQITTGSAGTQPLLYISGLTGLHPTVAGQIGINFVADPGSGTVVLVSVLR